MNRPTDPLRQMQVLRERLREAMAVERHRRAVAAQTWQPPTDLRVTDAAYEITLDLPGASRDAIELTADDGVLRVRGEVAPPADLGELRRLRSERMLGRFARAVRLPSDADITNTRATLADGVLTIIVGRRSGGGRITIDIEE